MSDARNAILDRIRTANRASPRQADQAGVEQWLRKHRAGPQPYWPEDRLARFVARVERSGATLGRITRQDVVDEVMRFRESHQLAGPLVSAATPLLKEIAWPDAIPVEYRAAHAGDQLAVSEAFCAVAETGSLVLRSGKETPTTLNFLPEYFICLVKAERVVSWMEDAWTLLRNHESMPRAINFVTGPSRTADVEQTIQMGAHGPRHVHVLLWQDKTADR